MVRSPVAHDVFTAISDASRRGILDALIEGEKSVGVIVDVLAIPQPQVSKHLRVLSDVGLVRCRADGRRRLYRLEPSCLRPLREWLAEYERAWHERMNRVEGYLAELQEKGQQS